jgi:hypothetical protein
MGPPLPPSWLVEAAPVVAGIRREQPVPMYLAADGCRPGRTIPAGDDLRRGGVTSWMLNALTAQGEFDLD